jgi:hypothetical protein
LARLADWRGLLSDATLRLRAVRFVVDFAGNAFFVTAVCDAATRAYVSLQMVFV